ncbi:MAG: DUF4197 domain-containing protein [Bacteroidales bacterium]|nr:DUF4197 domain-containing protein [Bacteroidales bacterium]
MKTIKWFFIIGSISLFFRCESLQPIVNEVISETHPTNQLTESEVINGLKEALNIGTKNAVNLVSKTDGFYKDEDIKILLPPEANVIYDNKDRAAFKAIGISQLIDDLILRLNRSAENASVKASEIFINAIKSMSIQDAFAILNGPDNAATAYFRKTTYLALNQAFSPVVKQVLDQPIVANISSNNAWSNLVNPYNKIAKFSSDLPQVEADLTQYVTQKTIDGLFSKIELEEKAIRKDPLARVTDLLKKVFGSH